jgi:hypothetical protein
VLAARQNQEKWPKVQIPENETKMTFQSPFDDFVLNSLAALRGLLARLEYVAGLRRGDGAYTHWGLARVHGETAAHQAASEAHHLLFSKVLSMPLAHLLEDAAHSQWDGGLDEYLEYLSQRLPELIPQGAGEGQVLHFNSALHAISALARARSHTSRQAA